MPLDGGSQRTSIREEACRRLMLRVIGVQRLTIYAFGSREAVKQRSSQRVECWLRNWRNNKRFRFEALEMPEIGGDFLPPPDAGAQSIAREQGIELADTLPYGYHSGIGVNLLVGAHYYWDIAAGNVKRLNGQLVAVETTFAWTL
ncbi:hypothetical protein HPB50_001308 [Hyalomma asiaticum]|uniref:Uncharacterized protein n=1 Tax=Hyalomma asiaticum TaxID=266040 RepID=A0ACB7SFF4_HYAAI|nr:hypothetical protein HPB50_001308 [Hyalomma asiaticum]